MIVDDCKMEGEVVKFHSVAIETAFKELGY